MGENLHTEKEPRLSGAAPLFGPLPRPTTTHDWWWCYHRGQWICGKLMEDWASDDFVAIWSDGSTWYRIREINVKTLMESQWFPATLPDWPNAQVSQPEPKPITQADQ